MSQLLTSIQSRLTTTSSLLLERARVLSLNLPPSASATAQITRNLTTLRGDIAKLEDEVELEAAGLAVGGGGSRKAKGGVNKGELALALEEVGERYDRLVEMLEEDEAGRDRARGLKRVVRGPTSPSPSPSRSESPRTPRPGQINTSRSGTPRLSVEPPTPTISKPFKDYPDSDQGDDANANPSGVDGSRTPQDMLDEQQLLMNDQDERLNLLSSSIGRQNHLSIQIGSELDLHHDLLEDTDAAMDRTSARLGRARRRLDTVAHEAKQYGSTITIIVLIFILLILIIVFKT